MRGASMQLFELIEERPRSVQELAAHTGLKIEILWARLSELCAYGLVVSKPTPSAGLRGRPRNLYDLADRVTA